MLLLHIIISKITYRAQKKSTGNHYSNIQNQAEIRTQLKKQDWF